MRKGIFLVILLALGLQVIGQRYSNQIITGADQMELYLPMLRDKKVALLVNQTSVIKRTHLVDTLLSSGVNIERIFAPEHGFRGLADAGEHIKSGVDEKTGLTITTMYGASKKPSKESMKGIEIVVFDIQDVGARFYTYISSLQYMMEACAEAGIMMVILDRPNPNGFYVDGPVMEMKHRSFVGMQSIPIVHGMTVGEYAGMLNGEKWLAGKKQCRIQVIPCKNYTHRTLYHLPVPPSPNLKSDAAILLYPSLCLLEGTDVSVGRGTNTPFEIWGHPDFKDNGFSFTPVSMPGASDPPHKNKLCFGADLHLPPDDILKIIDFHLELSFLKNAYLLSKNKDKFFTSYFEKLCGNSKLRMQIQKGISDESIRKSWEPALTKFKKIRKKYLLYADFE